MFIETPNQQTKLYRSGMETIFATPTTMTGVYAMMPPRWDLGLLGGVVFYKHVAPLTLGNPSRPITSNPIRI